MKFPVLISYAYAKKCRKTFEAHMERDDIDVLLDCGAFTAKSTGMEITLQEYCTFLDKWADRLFRYLALDVVGNPAGTDANLQAMLAAGYRPVPVHVLGDGQERMDYLFSISDYVACAGLKRPGKGHCSPEYIKQKMQWAAGRNVHWLGFVREEFFSLRPYSVDSNSWASSQMYGRMDIYLGAGKWIDCNYATRGKVIKNKQFRAILDTLGISATQLNNKEHWRSNASLGMDAFVSRHVTVDSWVRYVIDIYKKFGTRVFIATGLSDSNDECLRNAIARHRSEFESL